MASSTLLAKRRRKTRSTSTARRPSSEMFSVASNFDDELPGRLAGLEADELFGSCDDAPVGHGRPRAMVPPVSWRVLERHVARCRAVGLGFNLLLNPLCLAGREENRRLERRLRRAMARALGMGVTA